MKDLADLIERVGGAREGSRVLDAAIEHETRFQKGLQLGLKPEQIAVWRHVGNGCVESQGTRYPAPPYTASIDAALTLVERVLPGQWWNLLYAAMQDWRTHTTPDPSRLALALILAMLRVLEERGSASVAESAAAGPSACAATEPRKKSEGDAA